MGKSKRTPEGDATFFSALEGGHSVEAALSASGYFRTTVYAWRKRYPRFAAAWANANDIALAALEAEADRRIRARRAGAEGPVTPYEP